MAAWGPGATSILGQNVVTADNISAGAITARTVSVGMFQPDNLFLDPLFSLAGAGDTSNWEAIGSSFTVQAVSAATLYKRGPYRLLLNTSASPVTTTQTRSEYIPIANADTSGGDPYLTLVVEHAIDQYTSGTVRITFWWYDSSKSAVGSPSSGTVESFSGNTPMGQSVYHFKPYNTPDPTDGSTIDRTIPDGAAYMRVGFDDDQSATQLRWYILAVGLFRGLVPQLASGTEAWDPVQSSVSIQGGGILIRNGKLIITDSDGTTVMTGGGFAGPWLTFIHDGVYNSDISTAVAGTIPDGLTSALPHWTVSRLNLTSLTAVSSTSWPGGKYIEAAPSAADGHALFASDPVPVTPLVPFTVGCSSAFTQGGSAWMGTFGYITWQTAAGADIGSPVSYFLGYHKATDTTPRLRIGQPATAPANAAYAVVSFEVREMNAHSSSSRLRWGGGFFHPSDSLGSGASIWGVGAGPYIPWSGTTTLNANQANVYPMIVTTPTWISGCEIAFANTSGARSWEWALYYDASDGTNLVRRVAGLSGSASFTPSAIGVSIALATEGCNVMPGVYYLIIRNTQGSNNLILAAEGNALVTGGYMGSQTITGVKTSAGALGSTFDMSSLTSTGPTMAAVWLFAQNVGQAWGYGV